MACGSSLIVDHFNNLMDYMALVASLFISPFFAIFLIAMLWARPSATAGFFGMLGGLSAAASEYVLYRFGILHLVSPMAANLWSAVWGLCGGVIVMVTLTFLTAPPDVARLKGLVATRGEVVAVSGPALAWYRQPWFFAAIVLGLFTALNLIFF